MTGRISAVRKAVYDAVTSLVGGAINLFSPRAACFYRHGREIYRAYAAGNMAGPNQMWRPRSRSADADIKRAYKYVLARARDLAENNGQIGGAIERICNNAVRSGIRPQARFIKADGSPATARSKRAETLWRRWVNYADLAGIEDYYAIQSLCLRHEWIDGEILVHRVYDDSIPGVVPLRLELIECDHLDARVDGELESGNIARRGIEFDPATNRPVAYHILPQHPGDYLVFSRRQEPVRIPAEDIIHLYVKRRASQTRGISHLVAILMEAYDLSEYKAAERIGARLAAAFGVFVKSNYPGVTPGIGVPPGQTAGTSSGQAAPSWSDLPDYIEPGRIQGLPPGTEIQIASHSRPGTQYEPYVRDSERALSVGFGMSYEAFSNDYTNASYSSARSASLEERLSYRGMQTHLNRRLNNRVWAWFLEAAYLAGLLDLPGFAANPWPYYEAVSWQNPGWTWVDPLKDSRAAESGIKNVTTTRSRIAAQQGEDWEETLEQAIWEEERLSRLYELRAQNQAKLDKTKEIQNATE